MYTATACLEAYRDLCTTQMFSNGYDNKQTHANAHLSTSAQNDDPIQSISMTSGSASSSIFSSALSSMISPSSSSRRLLLGVKGTVPLSVVAILLRLASGGPISSMSSGAGRFFDMTGVAGVGARGLALRGGCGSGEGRMSAGASTGWFGL